MNRKIKRYRTYRKSNRKQFDVFENNSEKQLFLFKTNICIFAIIVILIISSIKSEKTNNITKKLDNCISQNTTVENIKEYINNTRGCFDNAKEEIEIFANDKKNNDGKVDDDMLNEINSKEDLYYKNQKK